MDELLKPFKLKLKILSPVHIGSGDRLQRVDFLVQNGNIVVIDQRKLLDWIGVQPNVNTLALTLAEDLRRGDLRGFLKRNYPGNISEITSYNVPTSEGIQPIEILSFIKTSEIFPYIPGTSLKGSLRSAWLRGRMIGNQNLLEQVEEIVTQGRGKRTGSDQIQAMVFALKDAHIRKVPNYDINRVIHIRDSDLMDASDSLQISTVRMLSINRNDGLSEKHISLFVETLKPGLEIEIQGAFQSNLFGTVAAPLGFTQKESLLWRMPDYCRRAANNLLQQDADFYRRHGRVDLAEWFERMIARQQNSTEWDFFLPLGWGSGYDAKTITDLLSEAAFEHVVTHMKYTQGLGKHGRNPDGTWLGAKDSPKSRKVVIAEDGSLQPMGWVAVQIQPEEESDDWFSQNRKRYALTSAALPVQPPAQPARPAGKPVPAAGPGPAPKPIAPPPPPPKKQLISSFKAVPKPGDCFEAEIFADEEGKIFLTIPGLDPDEQAYGVVTRSEYPLLRWKLKTLTVEVVGVEEEKKGYYRVQCKPYFG